MTPEITPTTTDLVFLELMEEMHALRVSGEKDKATQTYETLWQCGTNAISLEALLWAADIVMLRGKFDEVLAICGHLEEMFIDECTDLQGDLYRFKGLIYRFMFDFRTSAAMFEEAKAFYLHKKTPSKIADIATNHIEILAHLDPKTAINQAPKALRLQKEVGCNLEQGKIHTAVALAHLQLGNLDETQASIEQAIPVLEADNYTDGLARANIVGGLLSLRRGDTALAIQMIESAVKEFTRQNIYPTLIMACDLVLRHHGAQSPLVCDAAQQAEVAIVYQDKDPLLRRIIKVATYLASF